MSIPTDQMTLLLSHQQPTRNVPDCPSYPRSFTDRHGALHAEYAVGWMLIFESLGFPSAH